MDTPENIQINETSTIGKIMNTKLRNCTYTEVFQTEVNLSFFKMRKMSLFNVHAIFYDLFFNQLARDQQDFLLQSFQITGDWFKRYQLFSMQSKFNCDELHEKQVNAWTPSVFTFSDLVRSVFFINFTMGNENWKNFAVQGGGG